MEAAVNQFYENPNKYSQSSAPPPAASISKPVDHAEEPSMPKPVDKPDDSTQPAYSPPPYAPPTNNVNAQRRRPHTNPVIEAGNVRARDEVSLLLTMICVELTRDIIARDAERASETPIQLQDLQQRN